ncbi:MAG: M1 family metallopeptidase [Acidobacteriia bacterium]|nr:M1 family metallopeptidase [Terriglobia bacterium]
MDASDHSRHRPTPPAAVSRFLTPSILLAVAFAARADGAPVPLPEPLSPRNASYGIEVRLDPERHVLSGTETIRWRNATRDPAPDLMFHLYMNGFANTETIFMRESQGRHRQFRFDDSHWGNIVVSSLRLAEAGREVPLQQEFPGPDRTVMRARLPRPVPPGVEIEVRAAFEVKLPKVFARTGWAGRFHMAGQWFPKLGVWQEGKGWNCHPFHFASEFFSDFGTYDVAIDVPEDEIVGATGVVVSEHHAPAGRKTVLCHAEDVHDFAWTASPIFVERNDRWEGVRLRVLMQPENAESIPRYLEAAKRSLAFLARTLGPYPYPVLTLVDPPVGGWGAGGMEYPTLVTGIASPLIPRSLRLPEVAIAHEVAHQYWYGMSANNEFEEAWLDEGLASYCEMRILDGWLGAGRSFLGGLFGFSAGDLEVLRAGYLGSADAAPVLRRSWEYPSSDAYGAMSYDKPALILRTLESLHGTAATDRLLRTFFERARFRHPTSEEFLVVTGDVLGPRAEALVRELLEGTDTVDFEVLGVSNREEDPLRGYDLRKAPPALAEAAGRETKRVARDSEVWIGRAGALALPVKVRVSFADGSSRDEAWDGDGTPKVFRFPGLNVTSVEVDPERQVVLERYRLNNGWREERDPAPAARLVARLRWTLQALFSLLLAAF